MTTLPAANVPRDTFRLSRTPVTRSQLPRNQATSSRLTEFTYFRGRVALGAILRGLKIGRGDEVMLQGFTCEAVPEGVQSTGATPVYVDIEPGGLNLDPDSLSQRITPRARAIVVQHTLGIPAQLDRISEIASRAGIPIIEDCCHDLGSLYAGRPLGSFGRASFYSFEWGKPIVAGVGGAAVVNDERLRQVMAGSYSGYRNPPLAKQMQLELQYRAFGVLYRPSLYWPVKQAFHWLARRGAVTGNFRHGEDSQQVSADFGWQMSPRMVRRVERKAPKLPTLASHVCRVTSIYDQGAADSSCRKVAAPTGSETLLARYPLLSSDKPRLLALARERRIELAEWYRTVIHPLDGSELAAMNYELGSCPHAEQRARQIVSLPTHRGVSFRFAQQAAEWIAQE